MRIPGPGLAGPVGQLTDQSQETVHPSKWQDQPETPAQGGEHTVAIEKITPGLPRTTATAHASRAVTDLRQLVETLTTGGGHSTDEPLSWGAPEVYAILARLTLVARDTERALALMGSWLDGRNELGAIGPNHVGTQQTPTWAINAVQSAREQAEALTATLEAATEHTSHLKGGFVPGEGEAPH